MEDIRKGGNIAIYSAINVSPEIQNRIISVVNYDGPGFSNKIVNSINYNKILDKVSTYMPQSSIIGRLLEHKEKCIILESCEKGIYQHDIFSWQVLGTKPIILDTPTNESEFFNKTINNWLQGTNIEQRRIFVDTLFELLSSTNVSTFKEFSEDKLKNLNTLFKNYSNLNDSEKTTIRQLVNEFIISAKKSLFDKNF